MTNEEATTTHMRALAEQAAERLLGTCRSLHNLGQEFEAAQHYPAFAERLDDLVFCCSVCDWWCGHDEHHEDEGDQFVCTDCEPE